MFIKLKDNYFQSSSILSLRKTRRPGLGADKVQRQWVATVTPQSMGVEGLEYCNIWLSDEEVQPLLDYLKSQTLDALQETNEKNRS